MYLGNAPVIGIIEGEGSGPEAIRAAKECLLMLNELYNLGITFYFYDKSAPVIYPGTKSQLMSALEELQSFYTFIKSQNGVILRSAIYAWLVYRLRERFDQCVKVAFFNACPELEATCLLRRLPGSVIVLRENNLGLYHARENRVSNQAVELIVRYEFDILQKVAAFAFKLAEEKRVPRIDVFVKEDVLLETYQLWRSAFDRAKQLLGCKTEWVSDHPDAGFASLLLGSPDSRLIVATDEIADLIMDALGALYYGTRALPASVNIDPDTGFASYQTLHGSAVDIAGKKIINPLGMVEASAMLCEFSLNRPDLAALIRSAYRAALCEGYRTRDLLASDQRDRAVSTDEMTDAFLSKLRELAAANTA